MHGSAPGRVERMVHVINLISTIGAVLPQSPLNDALGFAPLPPAFFAVLAAFVVSYLVCVEVAKYFFYKIHTPITAQPLQRDHVHRLAARWSHPQPLHLQESSPNARQHRVRFRR